MFLMMSIQTRFSLLFFNSRKDSTPFLFSFFMYMFAWYLVMSLYAFEQKTSFVKNIFD